MRRKTGRAAGMAATGEALETWRRGNGGRGRAIPEALWREATELARTNGISKTARALRLDARRLDARVRSAAMATTPIKEAAAFVELGAVGLHAVGLHELREPTVVYFLCREGDELRIEIPPGVKDGVDLVALAQAFWSRGT